MLDVRPPSAGRPPSAEQAAAAAAARAAATKCTSVLHHQLMDYKRRPLHEINATVRALHNIMQAAAEGRLDTVRAGRGRGAGSGTLCGRGGHCRVSPSK